MISNHSLFITPFLGHAYFHQGQLIYMDAALILWVYHKSPIARCTYKGTYARYAGYSYIALF